MTDSRQRKGLVFNTDADMIRRPLAGHIISMTDAYRFFRSLEQHLNGALPGPLEVATNIADIVRASKAS